MSARRCVCLIQVLSPEDVAVYGGLCALATLEREELKSRVVDSPAFKAFLELVPTVRTDTQTDRRTHADGQTRLGGADRRQAGAPPGLRRTQETRSRSLS